MLIKARIPGGDDAARIRDPHVTAVRRSADLIPCNSIDAYSASLRRDETHIVSKRIVRLLARAHLSPRDAPCIIGKEYKNPIAQP